MATYKAVANGNADTLAIWQTWNGSAWVAAGSLPSTSDDVYTNNYIVTVTTSQSYLSWNRSSVASPVITQGGQFQIDGSNIIITQGVVNGTNVAQSDNPLGSCVNRLSTHIAKLTHIGNIIGGSSVYTTGVNNSSIYSIDIIGDMIGGSSTAAIGFYNKVGATITITGNQIGGSGGSSWGFLNFSPNLATITITGNQIGGSTSAYGFFNYYDAVITIYGNQIAGVAYAIYNYSTAGSTTIFGSAYASGINAIYNQNDTATIIYQGNLYNNLSILAIKTAKLYYNVTPTTVWEFSDFGGNSQYLYGAGVNTGHPTEANTRLGTVYGPNSEFTGTLAVPPAESVVKNVPVDATVGTWAFDATLITRLENCSTVDITAAQIAGFEPI